MAKRKQRSTRPVSSTSAHTCAVTLANARWNPNRKRKSKTGNELLTRKQREDKRKKSKKRTSKRSNNRRKK